MLVYGNPLGLELIAEKDRVNSRLDALEAETVTHKTDITAHQAENKAMSSMRNI